MALNHLCTRYSTCHYIEHVVAQVSRWQMHSLVFLSNLTNIFLYASETWTLRKVDIQRLESYEMWIWRRLMKISWTEHRSNQDVLDMVDENRSLMSTIRQRQKNWLGQVLRS